MKKHRAICCLAVVLVIGCNNDLTGGSTGARFGGRGKADKKPSGNDTTDINGSGPDGADNGSESDDGGTEGSDGHAVDSGSDGSDSGVDSGNDGIDSGVDIGTDSGNTGLETDALSVRIKCSNDTYRHKDGVVEHFAVVYRAFRPPIAPPACSDQPSCYVGADYPNSLSSTANAAAGYIGNGPSFKLLLPAVRDPNNPDEAEFTRIYGITGPHQHHAIATEAELFGATAPGQVIGSGTFTGWTYEGPLGRIFKTKVTACMTPLYRWTYPVPYVSLFFYTTFADGEIGPQNGFVANGQVGFVFRFQ